MVCLCVPEPEPPLLAPHKKCTGVLCHITQDGLICSKYAIFHHLPSKIISTRHTFRTDFLLLLLCNSLHLLRAAGLLCVYSTVDEDVTLLQEGQKAGSSFTVWTSEHGFHTSENSVRTLACCPKASILTKNFLLLPSENIHRSWKLIHVNNQQTPRDLQGEVAFSGITCQM